MKGGSTEKLKTTTNSRVGYQPQGSEASHSITYFNRPGMLKDFPDPLRLSKQCGQANSHAALRDHLRGSSRKSHVNANIQPHNRIQWLRKHD